MARASLVAIAAVAAAALAAPAAVAQVNAVNGANNGAGAGAAYNNVAGAGAGVNDAGAGAGAGVNDTGAGAGAGVNGAGAAGAAESPGGALITISPSGVREVQQALNRLGYFAGPVDGVWDRLTADAMVHFQEAHGLEPTGNINFSSIAAMGLWENLIGHPIGSNNNLLNASNGAPPQRGKGKTVIGGEPLPSQRLTTTGGGVTGSNTTAGAGAGADNGAVHNGGANNGAGGGAVNGGAP
jgi:Putative peptidoglycan binding domain